MTAKKRRCIGFSLIELLVVVAIIALLMAILIPVIAKAREQSRTVACRSAMRNIGRLIMTFASEHDGRGPGRGYYDPTKPLSGPGVLPDWADILNAETLGQCVDEEALSQTTQMPAATLYGRREQVYETSNPYWKFPQFPPTLLLCPNYDPGSYDYGMFSFPYNYNYDAAGGHILEPGGLIPPDQYGKLEPLGNSLFGPQIGYSCGPNLGLFRPDEFLVVESEFGPETIAFPKVGRVIHSITLNDPPLWPYYAGSSGRFAFRHPYTKTANFLYFDGHVGTLTPKDDINDVRFLSLPGSYPGT